MKCLLYTNTTKKNRLGENTDGGYVLGNLQIHKNGGQNE
jgi:hypothetical protein